MEKSEFIYIIHQIESNYKRIKHRKRLDSKLENDYVKGHGRILHFLKNNSQGLTQKELAELMSIRPQSLTEAIDVLERDALIIRQQSLTDKRALVVKITEKGLKYEEINYQIRNEVSNEMFSCLSEEEEKILLILLNKVVENCKESEEKAYD